MANNTNKNKAVDKRDLENKISINTYGVGPKLGKESSALSDIVKQTTREIMDKYTTQNGGSGVIDNYTRMGLTSAFNANSKNAKLKDGEDVCKYGNQWVISIEAMRREYGDPLE